MSYVSSLFPPCCPFFLIRTVQLLLPRCLCFGIDLHTSIIIFSCHSTGLTRLFLFSRCFLLATSTSLISGFLPLSGSVSIITKQSNCSRIPLCTRRSCICIIIAICKVNYIKLYRLIVLLEACALSKLFIASNYLQIIL